MMRWWWFGPAITEAQLEREMQRMREGGIGGFEIQPVYPLAMDEEATGLRNLTYLDDEFLKRLELVARRARELGLRMDITLGSGWPFGGPWIAIDQAASRLRVERVSVPAGQQRVKLPAIDQGERLLAIFRREPADGSGAFEPLALPPAAADALRLSPPPTRQVEVWFFIASRTGQQVKRPAVGAEGFVLDHYDAAALRHYLAEVGDRLIKATGPYRPYAMFCDSLEVFGSDWSQDFLEEFQRRRGYDLKPKLPALVVDTLPESRSIRRDWAMTLTELFEDRFLKPLRDWARRHGVLLRVQNYGVPPAALRSHRYVDLPEGEGWHWRNLSPSRWAASGAHLYGVPVVSSETWTWLHSPAFRATPLDVKVEADMHFLQGINQLIGHGWPYSPPEAGYPGWRFYAAGVFNDKNPWWLVMPDLARYLSRVSYMLRQGRPVADVLIYLPTDDAWGQLSLGQVDLIRVLARLVPPELVGSVLDAGFNFDVFDDQALEDRGRTEQGALIFGDLRYRAVILPPLETMPVRTLERLAEFARRGGRLIAVGRLPEHAPGFGTSAAEHARLQDILRELFHSPSAPATLVAKLGPDFIELLRSKLVPDVEFQPGSPELGFVHRETSFADIYFIANTNARAWQGEVTFRATGQSVVVCDAVTGSMEAADIARVSGGRTTLKLALEPFGSRLIIIARSRWEEASEKKTSWPASDVAGELDLSANWELELGSKKFVLPKLVSWTELEDAEGYSGVGVYRRTIELGPEWFGKQRRVYLDFGEGKATGPVPQPVGRGGGYAAPWEAPVREAAVVLVNGQRVGAVWCPPYRVEVTSALRAGRNEIEIQVGNTAMNAMAARALPDYRLLWLRYGRRFEPQDMERVRALPSGLLGPVRLYRVELR